MIKSVEIQNFQSHPDTKVEFSDGLNVLTGSSRSGKSTIRRAIMWVITNRPSGNAMVSWWIKKGDKIKGETKVTITLDNGTVISRIKSDKLNGYEINGKVLEAVATGVPEEIAEAFNMSDVNMSGQFDAPYLVSESAGYVAQYLNSIINLEDADYFQSEVESRRRKCVQEDAENNKRISALSEEIKAFDWLDKAEELIARIKDRERIIEDSISKQRSIQSLHREYMDAQEVFVNTTRIVNKASKLLDALRSSVGIVQQLKSKHDRIKQIQQELFEANKYADIPIAKMERLCKGISQRLKGIQNNNNLYKAVTKAVTGYNDALEAFASANKELKQASRELDAVEFCPLCGKKRTDLGVVF